MQFQGFGWLSSHGICQPLYHAQEKVTIKLSSRSACSYKVKSARCNNISQCFLIKINYSTHANVG